MTLRHWIMVAGLATPSGIARADDDSVQAPAPPPPKQSARGEPELIYREAGLAPRKGSPFYDPSTPSNYLSQFDLSMKFTRTYGYDQEVLVQPGFRTTLKTQDETKPFIEQGYINAAIGKGFTVTAGKKTEYEGTGFLINPSDLLNIDKNIYDPIPQRDGQVFTRVAAHLGSQTLSVGFIPQTDNSLQAGKLWIQANGETIKDIEYHFQEVIQGDTKATTGLALSKFFGEPVEVHVDARYQSRQRGVDGDGSWRGFSSYQGREPSLYALAGGRYIISSRRTLIVEAIDNQAGLLPVEMRAYFDSLRTVTNKLDPPSTLYGRHYAYVAYNDEQLVKSTLLAASATTNADDQSIYANLQARYRLSPVSSVEFTPTFFRGRHDTEYGSWNYDAIYYLMFHGWF